MDATRRQALARLLRDRRERLSPAEVGLPSTSRRRTPGLRREEVALLADVGVSWYTWLEQGRDVQPSGETLSRITQALHFSPDEQRSVLALLHEPEALPSPDRSAAYQQVLDAFGAHPAYLVDRTLRVHAWNAATRMILFDLNATPERQLVRLTFAHREQFKDWAATGRYVTGLLRGAYLKDPHDPQILATIEALERDGDFRDWWAQQELHDTHDCPKIVRHPHGGELHLQVTTMDLAGSPGLRLFLYTPVPGTGTQERLQAVFSQAALDLT